MPHKPSKGKRIRRYEHTRAGHRRPMTQSSTTLASGHSSGSANNTRSSVNQHAKLAAVESPDTTSFDMLSVEPSPTRSQPSLEPTSTVPPSSQSYESKSTTRTKTSSSSETSPPVASVYVDSMQTSRKEVETSTARNEAQQLQVEPTSSIERTTLVVPATFSLAAIPPSTSGSTSSGPPGILKASGSTIVTRPTTWTRPTSSITHGPSASPSNPIVRPPISHSHISPALIAFMAIGGLAALGLSFYAFRRVRYKALHVSRSQFQLASGGRGGSTGVSGSESNKSFVSGGLGRLGLNKQKRGRSGGDDSPLWGGREKFSPQINYSTVGSPSAAHLSERIPIHRRRSLMGTLRRTAPGRLSKNGSGWNAIPEVPSVPTVKITDMDTNHHRGGSGSSFSGSPDPNLASIQVASVTRTLSATASYRGSPLPRPITILEHPRPAPKVPPKAVLKAPSKINVPDQIPPVPKIPDIPILASHLPGQKKHTDINSRGKIAVADISKPRPVASANPELPSSETNRTVGETDPMAMYTKYSAGLGVRNGSPEPIRRETSMAKKIAQITSSNTKLTISSTISQVSLSNRDTRALAAAAGVVSPTPSEEHASSEADRKQVGGSPLPNAPGTPGLGEVGNVMLRSFGQSGSMVPAYLETPAIGLDGRSSYLSTNLGSEAPIHNRVISSMATETGPQHIIAKAPTSETDVSTLAVSMADDSDRRTIMSAYSQDFMPPSQQAHMRDNPDYRSPTYSIYNYYGPDRTSRMPSMIHGEHEPEIGGAM